MTSVLYLCIALLLSVLLLHVHAVAPAKVLQRTMRQAARYGASNYQAAQAGAYAVRGGGGGGNSLGPGLGASSLVSGGVGQAIFKNAARPGGSSAYSYGGRQPAYGPNFALSTAGVAGRQPSLGGVFGGQVQGVGSGRPQPNAVYRGTGGRPGPGAYQG